MRATPVLIFTLLTLLATAGGCTDISRMTSSFQHMVSSSADRLMARRLLDDPIYFNNVRGPMALDVISFNGSVTVEADPELDHIAVLVERLATHGYGRKWEADDSLAEIFYTTDIVRNPDGPALVIRTGTRHPEPHFQRVRINIAMPELDGVQISTRNGDVVVENARGLIDISTNDGDIRVMTAQPITGPVTLVSSNGDIDYRVRAESTGAIDAEAERGTVSHHTRYGTMVVSPPTDHDTLKATLNDGTNPVYLRTSDGDIRVSVVADPVATGVLIRH